MGETSDVGERVTRISYIYEIIYVYIYIYMKLSKNKINQKTFLGGENLKW